MTVVHVVHLDMLLAVMSALPLGGAAGVAGSHNDLADRHVGTGRIVPALEEPADDHHFFKHDFPHDLKPAMEDKWSHPFPIVQDTKDYDRDFVKDENYDGGQWKLQTQYDSLRGRLVAARMAQLVAKQAANETGRQLDVANKKESDARARVQRAYEAKIRAEQEAEEALKKAEAKYRATLDGSASPSAVDAQERIVGQDTRQSEECRKELEKVRARLRDLQEQRVTAEAQLRESTAEEEVAEARQLEKEQDEAALEEKADKATTEYNSAHVRYEKSLAEEEITGRKLKDSEEQVRHFRHPNAKSFSMSMTSPSLWLMAIGPVVIQLSLVGL